MSSYTKIAPDYEVTRGKVERVAATRQMCCAKRDQMLLTKHKLSSFIRKPYADMDEPRWISEHFSGQIQPREIVGILVSVVIEGQTNTRIPLTTEQFEQERSREVFLTLQTPTSTVQGFAPHQ